MGLLTWEVVSPLIAFLPALHPSVYLSELEEIIAIVPAIVLGLTLVPVILLQLVYLVIGSDFILWAFLDELLVFGLSVWTPLIAFLATLGGTYWGMIGVEVGPGGFGLIFTAQLIIINIVLL